MIKVRITGLDATLASITGLRKQIPFAASKALNATGKAIAEAMPAEIEQAIDRPTPFTKSGVALLRRATKDKLEAVVGFKQRQAQYMKWQVEGGTYTPGRKGLRLPSAIQLNQYGNIPRGAINQMIAHARKDQGMKKAAAKRLKVSASVDLFYGDPVDKGGKTYPRGIYKVAGGALIPLIVFPQVSAKYRPKFDFYGKARKVADAVWQREFDAALADAIRTAK